MLGNMVVNMVVNMMDNRLDSVVAGGGDLDIYYRNL
jgi:hypothetical protein